MASALIRFSHRILTIRLTAQPRYRHKTMYKVYLTKKELALVDKVINLDGKACITVSYQEKTEDGKPAPGTCEFYRTWYKDESGRYDLVGEFDHHDIGDSARITLEEIQADYAEMVAAEGEE